MPDYNSLQVRFPNIMKEWNYKSNYLLINPNNILASYPDEVWWTCSCGKNYKMSPKKRVYYLKRHMKACPYCKRRRRKKYRHFKKIETRDLLWSKNKVHFRNKISKNFFYFSRK